MWSLLALGLVPMFTLSTFASEPSLEEISRRYTKRTEHGLHIPIVRQETAGVQKRGLLASIGLGNFMDVTYSVLVTVGGITTPTVLDTGSSDLWVLSDTCTIGCDGDVGLYPQASFQSVDLDVRLLYGDSTTGTFAFGLIGKDTVDLAGLTLNNQFFAAINSTNTSIASTNSVGIFGLGFPVNSVIWNKAFLAENRVSSRSLIRRERISSRRFEAGSNYATHILPDVDFRPPSFPSLSDIYGESTISSKQARQTNSLASIIFQSYKTMGPLLSRLVANTQLDSPMFAVTLQRNTIDVGGNIGQLSIGELPQGVKNDSLTWVPIRGYSRAEGGLSPPPDSPNEVYPIAWEVFIDDVYLDGQKLPRSVLARSSIALSALVDTGNSLLRGPADTVNLIRSSIGNRFSCAEPHTLAFQIGGQMFPVDPRDFARQVLLNTVSTCSPNLVATDTPGDGGYLFSWSLGMPFLKSVLSAYHYGNLTHPSQDPPRMGFLSTVPDDAGERLRAAVQAASRSGGNFPAVAEFAPSGFLIPAKTNSNGVPEATETTFTSNSVERTKSISNWKWLLTVTTGLLIFAS
ncbi:aspartic peptidase domain-containing protein [Crucibulum laeve]|uniref:Aspartic peptidase domain-containing protein n=1 Tax=Crucibulum laeve TaxID=68775 RepID=A0A5C3LWD1_9AGAR|nr:aspartic peptidase domain-containing protein [Crucibulum laeve]